MSGRKNIVFVSVEHGRPERFTGSHYDNVFIHYKEPVPDIDTAW